MLANVVRPTQSQMSSFWIVIGCSFSTVPNKKSFMKQKQKKKTKKTRLFILCNFRRKKKKEKKKKSLKIAWKYDWTIAETSLLKTNIGLNDSYYDGTFVTSTCIHGRAVNVPCKAAQLFWKAKNPLRIFQRQSELSAQLHCWRCPGAEGACRNLLLPALSWWLLVPMAFIIAQIPRSLSTCARQGLETPFPQSLLTNMDMSYHCNSCAVSMSATAMHGERWKRSREEPCVT